MSSLQMLWKPLLVSCGIDFFDQQLRNDATSPRKLWLPKLFLKIYSIDVGDCSQFGDITCIVVV